MTTNDGVKEQAPDADQADGDESVSDPADASSDDNSSTDDPAAADDDESVSEPTADDDTGTHDESADQPPARQASSRMAPAKPADDDGSGSDDGPADEPPAKKAPARPADDDGSGSADVAVADVAVVDEVATDDAVVGVAVADVAIAGEPAVGESAPTDDESTDDESSGDESSGEPADDDSSGEPAVGESAPTDGESTDDESSGDESSGEPADDDSSGEPAVGESAPTDGESTDDESSGDESSGEPADDDSSGEPAVGESAPTDGESTDDESSGDESGGEPADDDSSGEPAVGGSGDGEPTGDEPADAVPSDDEPDDTESAVDDEPSDDTVAGDSDTSADAATGPDESAVAPASAGQPSDDVTAASPEELADEIARLRAESAALQKQLDESTKAAPEKAAKRTRRSGRWWGSTICVVLGAILMPISVIGRWTATTLLDTETYVATVAPLAENEDIQEAIAFRVSEVIVDVIDIEALVRDDLPLGTRFLAGPIEGAARTVIDEVVQDFVSTDAFANFWADANRIGHEGVVAVFTGESTDNIDAADGRVVLNVGPLVQGVVAELDEILGLDLAGSVPDERLDGEFVIVDSEDLASLQGTIRLFDQLSVLIPILTFVLFAASIYLSRPRRIGWRNVGYAIVIPMALCVLLYTWARAQYLDGLPDDTHNPNAAAAFFDVTTRFLTRDLWVVLVIGVIILSVTWLVGPTGWAGRARAWWKELISKAGDESASSEVGEFPRWVARSEHGLLWATFVLGAATLLLWTLPTGAVVFWISVITALAMICIHLLAEIGRKADADIQADEDAAAEEAEVEAAHADAAKLEEEQPQ